MPKKLAETFRAYLLIHATLPKFYFHLMEQRVLLKSRGFRKIIQRANFFFFNIPVPLPIPMNGRCYYLVNRNRTRKRLMNHELNQNTTKITFFSEMKLN